MNDSSLRHIDRSSLKVSLILSPVALLSLLLLFSAKASNRTFSTTDGTHTAESTWNRIDNDSNRTREEQKSHVGPLAQRRQNNYFLPTDIHLAEEHFIQDDADQTTSFTRAEQRFDVPTWRKITSIIFNAVLKESNRRFHVDQSIDDLPDRNQSRKCAKNEQRGIDSMQELVRINRWLISM